MVQIGQALVEPMPAGGGRYAGAVPGVGGMPDLITLQISMEFLEGEAGDDYYLMDDIYIIII